MAFGDSLAWAPKVDTLEKADYSTSQAVYRTTSADGVDVTFKLIHDSTSPGLFTYSKWEIERWGDPSGGITPPGSWQVVSNAANPIVFALWGYWGNGGRPLTPGASTSYKVQIDFERPVEDLTFQINGIDAFTSTEGNNAFDQLTIVSSLDGVAQPSPVYSGVGNGFTRAGDVLTGDFTQPLGSDTGVYTTSDVGSATVSFNQLVDSVTLTYVGEAAHPTAASFQDAVQNWSYSLGDFTFEPQASADRNTLSWEPKRGLLSKPGYDDATATYTTTSDDGDVNVSFSLEGLGTTANKFSYHKWEIDRWGDPTGFVTDPAGSWQVVSNGFNDVVLGLWGYWGTSGAVGEAPTSIGDKTTHRLVIDFDKPVSDLRFQLNAINALLSGGFNSFDRLTATSSLGGVSQPNPVFSNEGPGFTRSGNVLTGDFNVQIGGGFQSVTDDGSADLQFPGAVDQVILTLVNEANHPQPAQFQNGQQGWWFSIGDLSFLPGISTEVVWAPRQDQLVKPGFTNDPATYQAASVDGGVTTTFDLTHLGTTGSQSGYSQWEINRWGDPEGIALPPGSWQVVSNSTNDITLGLWGYWGGNPALPMAVGDQTSYQLAITFDQPVSNLSFNLNGLNALIKQADGFNTFDILTVSSFLQSVAQGTPSYSQEGNAFTRVGDTFTGDFANQIVGVYGGQHVSDDGSVRVSFADPVDEVRLSLINRADHPTPAFFQTGQQTWSFSLGDLRFDYDGVGGGAQNQIAIQTQPSLPTEPSTVARHALDLAFTPNGDLTLRLTHPLPISGPWGLESSTDLVQWKSWSAPAPIEPDTQWFIRQEQLGGKQRYFRLTPAGLE